MSPCSSCIHYRVTFGSLHPVERWCVISGEGLSANDVWRNNPKAHTRKFGVYTEDVPECKFTMSAREVVEYDEWYASKITLYYRENRGTYESFHTDQRNQHWLDLFNEEREVETANRMKLWARLKAKQ